MSIDKGCRTGKQALHTYSSMLLFVCCLMLPSLLTRSFIVEPFCCYRVGWFDLEFLYLFSFHVRVCLWGVDSYVFFFFRLVGWLILRWRSVIFTV